MKIFYLSWFFLIINLCKIYCYYNDNNKNSKINNNYTDERNIEGSIQGKKILFESYKFYNNNILFNTPRNSENPNYSLAKYDKENNEFKPFPNDDINNYTNATSTCQNFISVVSFEADDVNNLYVLDEGNSNCSAKLYLLKMKDNILQEKIIYDTNKIFNQTELLLNDFVIDTTNNYAYITYTNIKSDDNKQQSINIIVIELESKKVHLREAKIDFDENYSIPNYLDNTIFSQNFNKKIISISLSCDGESLFISPFNNRKIYSIFTEELRENDKDLIINEAYKNDASLSLIASNMGNLFFTGIEQKVIYLASQIDNDLSEFNYRSLDKIDLAENFTFISKVSLSNGTLYITYQKFEDNIYKNGYIEKNFEEDNTYEKSYMHKCNGLIYKYDWTTNLVWIIFAVIVIFIIIFVIVENNQDLDNNKKVN